MDLSTSLAAISFVVVSVVSLENVNKCCGTNFSYFKLGMANSAHTQFIKVRRR